MDFEGSIWNLEFGDGPMFVKACYRVVGIISCSTHLPGSSIEFHARHVFLDPSSQSRHVGRHVGCCQVGTKHIL